MYGGRAYGSTYFAQAGGVPVTPPPEAAAGIGGSGFPADWLERRPWLEDQLHGEVAELVALLDL